MSKKEVFNLSKEELKICRQLTRQFGTSYFYATLLFPKKMRHATYALYAFFRVPDEIVDSSNNADQSETAHQLNHFISAWQMAYQQKNSHDPVLSATSKVFHHFQIPFNYSVDFLEAMKQDLQVSRYQTYQDLQKYMYGSAETVGLMMSYIIGFKSEEALVYAKKLGEAMQLTNFLRDINEDYQLRDRIYLPQEDLIKFNLNDQDISHQRLSNEFKEMMKFQIARARQLYRQADIGIEMLSPQGRPAVIAASSLYEGILDKIEQADYDIFSQRVYTTKLEKIKLLKKSLCKRKKQSL